MQQLAASSSSMRTAASCRGSRARAWVTRATAAPMMAPKAKKCKAKDSLYLFQWHRKPASGSADMDSTVKQLKALEKVSKDALWFTVKEAGEQQHVLVVTNDAKAAKKYQLQELPAEGEAPLAVALEGLPEPVQVPVPAIRAALQQRLMMEEDSSSSSSDSDEDDDMMTTTTKMDKKMKKEDKKDKKKDKCKAELPQTVEENPLAAQQAAALLTGAAAPAPAAVPMAGDGHEGAAEVVLGLVAKEQRRKLKDCVKDVNEGVHGDANAKPAAAPMPVAAGMMMEDDSTSSSSSSGSSSEDDEDGTMVKPVVKAMTQS